MPYFEKQRCYAAMLCVLSAIVGPAVAQASIVIADPYQSGKTIVAPDSCKSQADAYAAAQKAVVDAAKEGQVAYSDYLVAIGKLKNELKKEPTKNQKEALPEYAKLQTAKKAVTTAVANRDALLKAVKACAVSGAIVGGVAGIGLSSTDASISVP